MGECDADCRLGVVRVEEEEEQAEVQQSDSRRGLAAARAVSGHSAVATHY